MMNPIRAFKIYRRAMALVDLVRRACKSAQGQPMSKSLFASKTFWFNALTVTAELLQLVTDAKVIPPGAMTVVAGAVNIALRAVTDQPVHIVTPK